MRYPLREGVDISSGEGQVTLYPTGHDPMTDAVERLTNAVTLLQRITLTMENRAAERDTILLIPPSDGNGTFTADKNHARVRGKGLILAPYGSGRFAIKYGSGIIFQSQFAGSAVTSYIPFPFTWQEGVDIELYDPTAIGTLQEYYAYIVGTTE